MDKGTAILETDEHRQRAADILVEVAAVCGWPVDDWPRNIANGCRAAIAQALAEAEARGLRAGLQRADSEKQPLLARIRQLEADQRIIMKDGREKVAQLEVRITELEMKPASETTTSASRIAELKAKLHSEQLRHASARKRIKGLEAECVQAKSLAQSAEDDCQRAITARQKAELGLKCLRESTVDAKAYDQIKAECERLQQELRILALSHTVPSREKWGGAHG